MDGIRHHEPTSTLSPLECRPTEGERGRAEGREGRAEGREGGERGELRGERGERGGS